MRWLLAFILLVSLLLGTVNAQLSSDTRFQLRILEWNVENLFDTVHDEGFRDEEFLPQGERRWTSYRYWQKLNDIARVIAGVAEDGHIADLVGLCEVENDSALTMLTQRSLLRTLHYQYIMTNCEDERGIDVALLYQPARFRPLEHRAVRVPSRENGLRATRDILYVKGLVQSGRTTEGTDTLHVLVVHLPSRAGGHEGDRNRRLAARTLADVVDSIYATSRQEVTAMEPAVLLMGDFNVSRHDRLFKQLPLRLTDDLESPGTYCFQGLWQWLDHILISRALTADRSASPVRLPWQLEENKTYGGKMPRRTFRGPTYHGGISDHLPLLLDLRF